MTSKSFRAQLPALGPDEFERVRRWGEENCAVSALCREGSCVMWLVTRERARSREDHARSVRSALRKLSVDVTNLTKGHWLTLACSDIVRAEASAEEQHFDSTSEKPPTAHTPLRAHPSKTGAVREDEDRIVTLASHGRRPRSETPAVTKDA
jgi:hypothetical protein